MALKKSSEFKWPDLFALFLVLCGHCALILVGGLNAMWNGCSDGFLTGFYLRFFSVLFLFEVVEGRSRDRFIYMVFLWCCGLILYKRSKSLLSGILVFIPEG